MTGEQAKFLEEVRAWRPDFDWSLPDDAGDGLEAIGAVPVKHDGPITLWLTNRTAALLGMEWDWDGSGSSWQDAVKDLEKHMRAPGEWAQQWLCLEAACDAE